MTRKVYECRCSGLVLHGVSQPCMGCIANEQGKSLEWSGARIEQLHRELAAADTREKLLLTRAQGVETRLAAARAAVVRSDRDALCLALGFPLVGKVECDIEGCPEHGAKETP